METNLIEIKTEGETLRGILTKPEEYHKGVVMVHGFERNSSAEPKFKDLADRLAKENILSLRLDYSGCGLSDGDFRYTTIDKWTKELGLAIDYLRKEYSLDKIDLISHSFSGSVVANYLKETKIDLRTVLISPALDQKDLLRFWFTKGHMAKQNPELEINWNNYKEFLNEEEFIKDCEKQGKMSKSNYINPEYFISGKDTDYTDYLKDYDKNILHIHGDKDPAVPIESLTFNFSNKIIVSGGNHDLERPDMRDQWIKKAVEFLKD